MKKASLDTVKEWLDFRERNKIKIYHKSQKTVITNVYSACNIYPKGISLVKVWVPVSKLTA